MDESCWLGDTGGRTTPGRGIEEDVLFVPLR